MALLRSVCCVFGTLSLAVHLSYAFFPTATRMLRPDDQTHESITRSATLRAVAKFFGYNPRQPDKFTFKQLESLKTSTELWKKYYAGKVNSQKHDKAVADIITSIQNAATNHIREAKWTFGGERIKEGHQLLINLNNVFDSIMSGTDIDAIDYPAARQKLGEIFLVMQSFYANTNWIPMKTGEIYTALGKAGVTLMPIAPPNAPTCVSCPHTLQKGTEFSCDFNTLSVGVLTSGYRQGQDALKPTKTTGLSNQGKCSHGGLLDGTRKTPATGGINKGTKNFHLSPLWMNHDDAAQAAKAHTERMLVGGGGIFEKFKTEKFKKLFGIEDPEDIPTPPPPTNPPYSIGFAIDTTGSMAGDIAGVKKNVKNQLVVLRSKPKDEQPTYYVLSVFNDPGVGPAKVTTDPDVLLQWVNGLTVGGGDDCPEMAYGGIELAVQKMLASPLSKLFVFTDASAKDAGNAPRVTKMAVDKYIKISFLLTGKCGSRRKRTIRSEARPIEESTYYGMAKQSGGEVHTITKEKQPAILEKLLKNAVASQLPSRDVASSATIRMWHLSSTTSSRTLDIAVDGGIKDIFITIAGTPGKGYGIRPQLVNPYGIVQQAKDSKVVYYYLTSSLQIWVTPEATFPGVWKLELPQLDAYDVRVEGKSEVMLDLSLEQQIVPGLSVPLSGFPTPGQEVTANIVVTSDSEVETVSSLDLYLNDGTTRVLSTPATKLPSSNTYLADFVTPDLCKQKLMTRVVGLDRAGNQMVREIGLFTIAGASVDIQRASPLLGSEAGRTTVLQLTINNTCSTDERYSVEVSSAVWESEVKPSQLHVKTGGSGSAHVTLSIPASALPASSSDVTLTVSDASGQIVNQITKTETLMG